MSWTADEQEAATRVLLGSWPNAVASWGREGIAAYVGELEARGLTAEQAVVALRSWEGAFPPSAGDASKSARKDPGAPTFDEGWLAIRRALRAPGYAEARRQHFAEAGSTFITEEADRELLDDARRAAIAQAHPHVRRFVSVVGWERLAAATDEEWGAARLHELRGAWEVQEQAADGRQIAALASGSREGLRQLDPLASIDAAPRKELAA